MRASCRSTLLAILLSVICLGPGAWGQTYSVEKIAFTGSDLSQGELLAFTGLQAGGPIARDQMQAAANKLTGSGIFVDARFSFDDGTLTFALQPSPGVVPVEYDNFPWWDDKTLNAAVVAKVPLFHGGLYPGGPMRDQVTAVLAALLATKGVQGAAVSTTPVGDGNGTQVAIRYHIDSPAVVVQAFHVYDYSGVWTQPLEAVEKPAAGMKFEGSTRDNLGAAVRNVYGRIGFIGMTMTGPTLGKPIVENGKIAVPIQASITSEGGQFKVAALHLVGDGVMTEDQFAKSAKLHPGDVANEELWKQTQDMVTVSSKAQGYLDAKIDAAQTLDRANHTVDYTITVTPGAVYRMGTLTLANLNDAQKAELMPYWLMHKGDPFNADLIPKSVAAYHKQRAQQLQSIHTGFTAKWSGDKDAHVVDVVLTFGPSQN
ncbi:MAG TPA: POTRA domain-containing protein [Acidobacteriaceae bacterium]|jgi:outer membrane protein assembly factor BamA